MFVIMTLINLSWATTKEDNKLALRRILVRSLAGHSGQILSEKYRLSLNSQRPQSRSTPPGGALSIVQSLLLPASAEGFVELNQCKQLVPPILGKQDLVGKQALVGILGV